MIPKYPKISDWDCSRFSSVNSVDIRSDSSLAIGWKRQHDVSRRNYWNKIEKLGAYREIGWRREIVLVTILLILGVKSAFKPRDLLMCRLHIRRVKSTREWIRGCLVTLIINRHVISPIKDSVIGVIIGGERHKIGKRYRNIVNVHDRKFQQTDVDCSKRAWCCLFLFAGFILVENPSG